MYEYRCEKCGSVLPLRISCSQASSATCPRCLARLTIDRGAERTEARAVLGGVAAMFAVFGLAALVRVSAGMATFGFVGTLVVLALGAGAYFAVFAAVGQSSTGTPTGSERSSAAAPTEKTGHATRPGTGPVSPSRRRCLRCNSRGYHWLRLHDGRGRVRVDCPECRV